MGARVGAWVRVNGAGLADWLAGMANEVVCGRTASCLACQEAKLSQWLASGRDAGGTLPARLPSCLLRLCAPALPLLLCRKYLARRQLGPPAASPVVTAAQRAAALLTSPIISGMAGVLSLMGLLEQPAGQEEGEEQQQQQAGFGTEGEPVQQPAAGFSSSTAAAAPAAAQAPATTAAAAAGPAAAAAPSQQQREREAVGGGSEVPAGRSAAEVTQAAAAQDMSQVDMRTTRQTRPKAIRPEELKPRHTARPELTAAAMAPPPPPPVPMPPPVPEAGPGEDFDANVAFAMQVKWCLPCSQGVACHCLLQQLHWSVGAGRFAAALACCRYSCRCSVLAL